MSKIEWTDETWNPVTGCTKVSPGCKHCYAERMATRLRGRHGYPEDDPFRVTLHPDRLDQPLRWRQPRRVFVCSMSDLFHPDVPDEYIRSVFVSMETSHKHTFQVLTKRPERMAGFLQDWWSMTSPYGEDSYGPAPNVWLGTSVEDQERADERIPHLLKTPAAVRFLSCEPLLGPVALSNWLPPRPPAYPGYPQEADLAGPHLNWVIVGGESGPGARPMNPDWARSIRDQCQAVGVPFFFKQHGAWASVSGVGCRGEHHYFKNGPTVRRVGKKAAGRELDGRTWDEYPEAPS